MTLGAIVAPGDVSTYSCPVPWSMMTTDVLKFDGSGAAT